MIEEEEEEDKKGNGIALEERKSSRVAAAAVEAGGGNDPSHNNCTTRISATVSYMLLFCNLRMTNMSATELSEPLKNVVQKTVYTMKTRAYCCDRGCICVCCVVARFSCGRGRYGGDETEDKSERASKRQTNNKRKAQRGTSRKRVRRSRGSPGTAKTIKREGKWRA